eukprot:gene23796-28820_t
MASFDSSDASHRLNCSLISCASLFDLAILGNQQSTRSLQEIVSSSPDEATENVFAAKAFLMILYERGQGGLKEDHEKSAGLGNDVFSFIQRAIGLLPPASSHFSFLIWMLGECYFSALGVKKDAEPRIRLKQDACLNDSTRCYWLMQNIPFVAT